MKAPIRIVVLLAACVFASYASAQATGLKPPPEKATKPKPASKAQKKPGETEEDNPGVQAVEKIFKCVAAGLPKEWRRAWVVVTELTGGDKERSYEGKFHYSLDPEGTKPVPLVPCNPREVAQGVYALNEFLEHEKRAWKVATLTFTSDGKFEIKYDYAPAK